MTKDGAVFAYAPLIDPARIAKDGKGAFSALPRWAEESLRYFHPADKVELLIGRKYALQIRLTLNGLALCCELTRFEGVIASNPAVADKKAKRFARLFYRDAPEALVPVLRLMANAGEGEVVTTRDLPHEITADNVTMKGGAWAKRNARELALYHAERIARKWQAEERLPHGFDIPAYLTNLVALFQAIDVEAAGGAEVAEEQDPFEGEGVMLETGAAGTPSDGFDFGKLTRSELLANLALDIADISQDTRQRVKSRLNASDQFIDHHLRDTLAGWLATIDSRMAERRKARLSAARA